MKTANYRKCLMAVSGLIATFLVNSANALVCGNLIVHIHTPAEQGKSFTLNAMKIDAGSDAGTNITPDETTITIAHAGWWTWSTKARATFQYDLVQNNQKIGAIQGVVEQLYDTASTYELLGSNHVGFTVTKTIAPFCASWEPFSKAGEIFITLKPV